MFGSFFKKSNKKLEFYFKENTNNVDLFKEHYDRFKPTLDRIKSFDSQTLHNVINTRDFAQSDLKNLFSDTENRNEFVSTFRHDSLPELSKYNNLLSKLNYDQNEFFFTKEYFCDENNLEKIRHAFLQSRIYSNNLSKHPDVNTCVDLLFQKLEHLTNSELRVLSDFVNNNEQYALVTLEPYLSTVLGTILFLNVTIPLHKSGAFSLLINKVVDRHIQIRSTISSYLYGKNMKTMYKYALTRSNAILSLGLVMLNLYNSSRLNLIQDKSTVVTDLVNKYIDEAKKLEDPFTQTASFIFKKAGFVVGHMLNSITQGVIMGISSKNSDSIIIAAKKADGLFDKK
jgi:hypothetical protein